MKARYLTSCAMALVLGGGAGQAFAADAPASANGPSAGGDNELIVTASRREESVQNVPMTLQAFSGDTLNKLNVETLTDLLKFTPNVTYGANGPGQGSVFMRGLSAGQAGNQSSATVGNFPNVAIYLDDQSMQFPGRNVDIYMADIDRVEVLEGPQGTLFGGGAEAGALRYITNKPKVAAFEANVVADYGFTAHGSQNASATAVLNVPVIKDRLAIRAVIYSDREGGYIDNVPSTFTRSNEDNNVYFGIKPTAGVCPNGLPPGHTTGLCTPLHTGVANNSPLVAKDQNPVTHQGARVSAQFDVNEDWNVLITESLSRLDAEGLSMDYPVGTDFQPLKPLQVTAFSPTYDKDRFQNTAWTINGKVGPLKLIYTGAYTDRHISQQNDYTNYSRTLYGQYYECTGGTAGLLGGGPITCYSPITSWHDEVQNTHLSNEIRVSTPSEWRVRAIVGGYIEQFRIHDLMDFNYKTIPSCDHPDILANALAGGPPCLGNDQTFPGSTGGGDIRGDNTGFGEDVRRGYDQKAVFGSVDFDIIPNRLTITAGSRYYNYDEFEVGSVYSTNGHCLNIASTNPASTCGFNTNIDAENLKVNYHGFKSRAGVQWKPDDKTMVYFLFSQGFRPGGFSRSARLKANDAQGHPQFKTPLGYAPDELTNYEVGVKSQLFDRRLQVNLSAYWMQWDNVQIALYQPCCLGNTTFLVNGPDYDIKGVEAQLFARVTEALTLQGSISYNDNKQSNSPCLTANLAAPAGDTDPNRAAVGSCITEIKGIPFVNPFGVKGGVSAFSPKVQFNVRGRYDWMVSDFNMYAMVGVSYTGKMFNQPANYTPGSTPSEIPVPDTTYLRYPLPAYATVDASLGVHRDNWSAQIYGTNLFDSQASTFITSAQFIKAQVPLRPRVVGMRITAAF
jgi:outer membrane receptor protein involved in Fe transport